MSYMPTKRKPFAFDFFSVRKVITVRLKGVSLQALKRCLNVILGGTGVQRENTNPPDQSTVKISYNT